jgi:hypothetical protein
LSLRVDDEIPGIIGSVGWLWNRLLLCSSGADVIKGRGEFKHGSAGRGWLTSYWDLLERPSSWRSVSGMIVDKTFIVVSVGIWRRRRLGVGSLSV